MVKGTLNSTPNTSFGIELYSSPKADPSGYGEGKIYLPSSRDVTTDGSGRATFTYTLEKEIPIGHVVSATALPNDQVGGTLSTSEFSEAVTVRDAPPVVASVRPTAGATGVVPGANVTAVFSEAMQAATINATTFALVEKGTAAKIPAVVRYDADRKRVILNPKEPLRAGVAYVARVRGGDGGVEDLAGKALSANKTWGFTVAG